MIIQKIVNMYENMHLAAIGLFLLTGIVTHAEMPEDPLYYGESDETDFVMRWHYQYCCDHTFDPRKVCPTPPDKPSTFNPDDVKPGDTIFVRNAPKFFKEMHPHIKHPYFIVSAGESSDRMLKQYKPFLDEEKVIAWFGIHPISMAMDHPKFHALPLGTAQSQKLYENRKSVNETFKKLRRTSKKESLVYVNFLVYPRRKKMRQLFNDKPFCKYADRKSFDPYITEMAQCYFTLSPEGTGPDCYRTWEALLVGSIPVVLSSSLDPLFEGLPVLIVKSWKEAANEEFLKKAYQRITSQKYDIQKLYANYWTSKIKEAQNNFRMKRINSGTHKQNTKDS